MAISRCVALSSITPYSSFSSRKKGIKFYRHVSLPRSVRASARAYVPKTTANQTALKIMRTISEKTDCEIQDELSALQKFCHQFKGFLGQIILVLMAKTPLVVVSKAMASNDYFLCWSSFGASYGAWLVLREGVKLFFETAADTNSTTRAGIFDLQTEYVAFNKDCKLLQKGF